MSRLPAALALLLCMVAAPAAPGGGDPPTVAVAANMTRAAEEIAAAFEARTGQRVRLAFGSTGNLYRQILQRAPFEVFVAADEGFVARLYERGITGDAGVRYAVGRIGLFVPRGSPLARDDDAGESLRAAADRGARLAIAHPVHAPYGRAARQAIETLGLWRALAPNLVIGENVAQTVRFGLSGSVDAAIIPLSYAGVPQVERQGRFALVPRTWHEPLNQRMVLLPGATVPARAFYDFMRSAPARAILERYGYELPASSSDA